MIHKGMTDKELIVIQARQLAEKNEEVVQLLAKANKIRLELISIGAPLNDNLLEYNREQLKPFFKIRDILNG